MIDAIIYLDSSLDDSVLYLGDTFIPHLIADKIRSTNLINEIWYAASSQYRGLLTGDPHLILTDSGHDDSTFWNAFFSRSVASHCVKIYADAPFFDTIPMTEMIHLHKSSLAEYTFSENIPEGLGCDILSRSLFDGMDKTASDSTPVSKTIKANINQFDVEIYYRKPDIRSNRLTFRTSSPRDHLIMSRLFDQAKGIPSYDSIESVINNNPEVLFVGPSYIDIELTDRCDLNCIFCSRKHITRHRGDIDLRVIDSICAGMHAFALPYTVCLGGYGEPLMHADFYGILAKILKEDLVQRILIETNGIYADRNFQNFILQNPEKITVIININAYENEQYFKIHGKDFFSTVHEHILSLSSIENASIFLQILKTGHTKSSVPGNDAYEYLDAYYDFWEKVPVPIILQKQNTFLNEVEDFRYSDLTPLERSFCWHLQRDLNILANGEVVFCKQDFNAQSIIGNMATSSISEIWNCKKEYFVNDYKKKINTSMKCISCDEWYTFNL